MPDNGLQCFACGKALDLENQQKIHRTEDCPHCDQSLHCCRMCQFYDSTAYNECRESSAERILEKEKANYCDYFILGIGQGGQNQKEELWSDADALFKK